MPVSSTLYTIVNENGVITQCYGDVLAERIRTGVETYMADTLEPAAEVFPDVPGTPDYDIEGDVILKGHAQSYTL